ncbi:hypothetical protein, partial [Brevibacillus porteri]|uniref:hypothetical protein n=1 Tax=Brevibacillus porteri TaxID=2126350 RepID=UPI002E226C4A|nr:hypothetical protein [Brevibacillus porteri]
FLMLFFIGMGLGMNIEIAVVLPYGYSYSDSNRKCDCINVFGVFERIEKAEALPVKQKNMFVEEVVISLQENSHRSVGR